MASVRKAAQDVLDEARDGIAWIAFWQDGKGWMSMAFWPDYDERTNTFNFEDYELERLRSIFRLDPEAILVNSYYHNLGDTEDMTRDSLANALRWQYVNKSGQVLDILLKLCNITKNATTAC